MQVHPRRFVLLVSAVGVAVWLWASRCTPPPPPPSGAQVILGDPAPAEAPTDPVGGDLAERERASRPTETVVDLEATKPKLEECDPSDPMCGGL